MPKGPLSFILLAKFFLLYQKMGNPSFLKMEKAQKVIKAGIHTKVCRKMTPSFSHACQTWLIYKADRSFTLTQPSPNTASMALRHDSVQFRPYFSGGSARTFPEEA